MSNCGQVTPKRQKSRRKSKFAVCREQWCYVLIVYAQQHPVKVRVAGNLLRPFDPVYVSRGLRLDVERWRLGTRTNQASFCCCEFRVHVMYNSYRHFLLLFFNFCYNGHRIFNLNDVAVGTELWAFVCCQNRHVFIWSTGTHSEISFPTFILLLWK